MAEVIPVHELRSNNRGELRAVLWVTLICIDCIDPWEEILPLLAVCGHEVHGLTHLGINSNHKADELADVGHQKSPLLFGHILVNMMGRVEDGVEAEEGFDERSLLGMGEEEPVEEEDPCAFSAPCTMQMRSCAR